MTNNKDALRSLLDKARQRLAEQLEQDIASFCSPIGPGSGRYDRASAEAEEAQSLDELEAILFDFHRELWGALPAGTKVRLKANTPIFDLGILPAGATGVVTEVVLTYIDEGPCARITMDKRHPALAEWNNVVQLCEPEDTLDVHWSHFEAIEVAP